MRDVFPDRISAVLIAVLPDGRGTVELDSGAQITISFPPAGAASVGVGTRGEVSFTGGDIQRAWWRTCSCGDRSDGGYPLTSGEWHRRGVELPGGFWLAEEILPIFLGAPVDYSVGAPWRSYSDNWAWAYGSDSTKRHNGSDSSVDHGGEVVALWSDGAHRWALVQTDTTPAGYEQGYDDGYAAAASSEADLLGSEACLNDLPYNPEGSNPGVPEASGSEDYLDGYEAGWNAGWIDNYRNGYESGGCTVPE